MKDVTNRDPQDSKSEYQTHSLKWVQHHMDQVVYFDKTMEYTITRWDYTYSYPDPNYHDVNIHFSCLKDNPADGTRASILVGANLVIAEYIIERDEKDYFFREVYHALRNINDDWFKRLFLIKHPRVKDAILPYDEALKEWSLVERHPSYPKVVVFHPADSRGVSVWENEGGNGVHSSE